MTAAITDAAWWKGDPRKTPPQRSTGMRRNSYLVPMADGTRLAAHVFLPDGVPDGERLPTVMSITPCSKAAVIGAPGWITRKTR